MFVLLEHSQADRGQAAAPDQPTVHWDFLVEVPGHERLATWRLTRNPATDASPIPAARLADHRRIYLEYEGTLSDNRGAVRQVDRGDAAIRAASGAEFTIELHGRMLDGLFEIAAAEDGLCFRRAVMGRSVSS